MSAGLGERELGRLLREAPVPADAGAAERGLDVVLAAHAERRPRHRSPLPRLAVALAVAALLGALLLSPAWAAVRGWVGGVFESAPATKPAPGGGLGPIPGGGRLLVQGAAGPWVVAADGSRHLLGDYDEASWSPRGLFVAAVSGRRLSAVAPDGDAHWTLTAPGPVRDPRWSPPTPAGVLIAYRAGPGLRIVAGDGSGDRPLDESVAPVAPAWAPGTERELAYVDARGALRVVDPASGREAARATALGEIDELEWGLNGAAHARGGLLLEASPARIRLRRVVAPATASAFVPYRARRDKQRTPLRSRDDSVTLGRPSSLPVPPGERVRAAALSPDGRTVAALLSGRRRGATRTDLVLYSTRTGAPRRLGSVPGDFTELAWSPGGGRLLVAWPSFDEWLFVPPRFAEGRALSGVRAAFGARRGAPFPAVAGWCCRH